MTSALVDSLRKGNRLALSRILSQVENGSPEGLAALEELFLVTGSAQKIGITGPPGSGKSTLVNALARELRLREPDKKVAIIALARALGLRVIAEGVETTTQMEVLYNLGCHICQGFLFARPMPADQVSTWVSDIQAGNELPQVSSASPSGPTTVWPADPH